VLNNGEDKTLGGTNGDQQADKVYFCAFQTKNKIVWTMCLCFMTCIMPIRDH